MLKLLKKKSPDSDLGSGTAWLFVGLGNPGNKYSGNRHNVGFMTVDAVAAHFTAFPAFRSKFQAQMSEAPLEGVKAVLLKPQTYMNNSGQSVAAAAKFFKISHERIVVFHDELDLPAGRVKIKQGGGNAGHNGLSSISDHLGTPDFWRVRIGIGHPGDRDMVSNYVLSDFAKTDNVWLATLLETLAAHSGLIATGGPKVYEQKINQLLKPAEAAGGV